MASPDVTLLFAPVRKHRTAFIIEKGTELGVYEPFNPSSPTARNSRASTSTKRELQAIEAAEQTERLDIPEVKPARPLLDVLSEWGDVPLLFADEAGNAEPAKEVCAKVSAAGRD